MGGNNIDQLTNEVSCSSHTGERGDAARAVAVNAARVVTVGAARAVTVDAALGRAGTGRDALGRAGTGDGPFGRAVTVDAGVRAVKTKGEDAAHAVPADHDAMCAVQIGQAVHGDALGRAVPPDHVTRAIPPDHVTRAIPLDYASMQDAVRAIPVSG